MVLPRITVFGAGCIGSYLAGVLLPLYKNELHKIAIVAREKQYQSIISKGLTVTDYLGYQHSTINNVNAFVHTSLSQSKPNPAHLLLLTVKCTAIQSCLTDLSHCIDKNTVIVCLQNGVGSDLAIKQAYPENTVIKAIVGFNVVKLTNGQFHKATEGEVIFEQTESADLLHLIHLLNQQKTKSYMAVNYIEIQWAKLLLNLNNAINALAGIPLKEELEQHIYRKVLAGAMAETLKVLKAVKIKPAKLTPAHPSLIPFILRLPTPIFTLVARQMLAIDPSARSSMYYDLEEHKLTEVSFINGAVVQLGKQIKINTPINQQLVKLIEHYSIEKCGSPRLSGIELMNKTSN